MGFSPVLGQAVQGADLLGWEDGTVLDAAGPPSPLGLSGVLGMGVLGAALTGGVSPLVSFGERSLEVTPRLALN